MGGLYGTLVERSLFIIEASKNDICPLSVVVANIVMEHILALNMSPVPTTF